MSEFETKNGAEGAAVAIIGTGNLGSALAHGLLATGAFAPASVILTRRRSELLEPFASKGFVCLNDNRQAARRARLLVIAVRPNQLAPVLDEIRPELDPAQHALVSTVTGFYLAQIAERVPEGLFLARAMPNIAVEFGESMTCLATHGSSAEGLELVRALFDGLGQSLFIDEELMTSATALCACGIAFFLRSIRAASQGGIQIGFHSHEALAIAAQTARGAASLLLRSGSHPESKIDNVTTPRGCTIAGLNEMEHRGFSSAMIRGIVTSYEKAAQLLDESGASAPPVPDRER